MPHLIAHLPLALVQEPELAAGFGGTEGPDLTRYFTVCAILLVVTGLLAWGSRRLFASGLKKRASQRSLQTLDVLPLGGKQKLVVVRCYDRTFALGVGDHEITPIAELDSVEAPEAITVPAGKANDAAFAQALEAVRKSMPRKEVVTTKAPLPTPVKDTVEVSAPRKRVVRKKVRKAKARPATPEIRQEDVAAVAAAARELAADKARARQARKPAPEVRPQATAQAQVARPQRARTAQPAAEPKPAPQQPRALRLEGVLG